MKLQEFRDNLSTEIFGTTKDKVIAQNLCIQCKEPALLKCYSSAGIREYHISGLCEECFDKLFESPDEEIAEL